MGGIAALIFLCAVAVFAAQYIVIKILHRPAAELVEGIRAVLTPGGTVIADTGNNTLIVMDEPATLVKVRELAAAMDTAGRQVRLTVTFFETVSAADVDLLVRWRYADGGFFIGNYTGGAVEGGLSVGAQPRAMWKGSSSTTTQDILVMSGQSGTLITGESVPITTEVLGYLREGGVVTGGVVFREVACGFQFTPTILENAVRIDIAPVMSYFTDRRNGSVTFYQARTTVTVAPKQTVVITESTGDRGKFIADIFSGFSSSNVKGKFYLSITPSIED
jgi:type II secretory pathway component GspD/PulD (secretin)